MEPASCTWRRLGAERKVVRDEGVIQAVFRAAAVALSGLRTTQYCRRWRVVELRRRRST